MGFNDIDIKVSGGSDLLSTLQTYTTKILKPNIVDGKNILTQEMLSSKNTKYVIKYDFKLESDITIPANCVLQFEGGCLSGEHTVTGSNTGIQAGLVQIFSTDITIAGSWNVAGWYVEWFGAKGDGITDDAEVINKVINLGIENALVVYLSPKTYFVTADKINFNRSDVSLTGSKATIKSAEANSYKALISQIASTITDIKVEGITFNNLEDTVVPTANSFGCKCIYLACNNMTIENCTFYCYGGHAFTCIGLWRKNIIIRNNKVFFSKKDVSYNYDCSGFYVDVNDAVIEGNYVNGLYNNPSEARLILRGGFEVHGDKYLVTNNVVENCIHCINVTNHTPEAAGLNTNGDEPKIISNNSLIGCGIGIAIWPIFYEDAPDNRPIRNLQITNNSICSTSKDGCCIGINKDSLGGIDGFIIANNVLSKASSITTSSGTLYYELWNALISLCSGDILNVFITGNVLENANLSAVLIKPEETYKVKHVVIQNNVFKNCSEKTHPTVANHNYNYPIRIVGNNGAEDIHIKNNQFVWDNSIQYLYGLVELTNVDGNCEVLYNSVDCVTFQNGSYIYKEDIQLCKFDVTKVTTDFVAYANAMQILYNKKCVVSNTTDIPQGQYHKGDILITSDKTNVVIGNYTNKTYDSPVTHSSNMDEHTFECVPGYHAKNIKVGDSVKFSAASDPNKEYVVAKVAKTYFTVIGDALENTLGNVTPYKGVLREI